MDSPSNDHTEDTSRLPTQLYPDRGTMFDPSYFGSLVEQIGIDTDSSASTRLRMDNNQEELSDE